jgi:hypothetical protein
MRDRLKRAFLRLRRPTIWDPSAIPESEKKYATPLKRVALPFYDLILVVAGFYAVRSGIPALDELFDPGVSFVVGLFFAALAVTAFVGISYPRLWRIEIGAKVLLMAVLGIYLVALRILSYQGSDTKDFVSGLVAATMVVPLLRLWILGTEIRDRGR